MNRTLVTVLTPLLLTLLFAGCEGNSAQVDNAFPLCLEYYEAEGAELDPSTLLALKEHGVDRIFVRHVRTPQTEAMVAAAEEMGLKVEFMTHGYELLNRNSAPPVSVYDPAYADSVRVSFAHGLADAAKINNRGYVYPYQDEPFHILENLDYSPATRAEFSRRYGYEMPRSFQEACRDPRTQVDFINFQAGIFRDGWQKCYEILNQEYPGIKIAITHDSHNVYGSGVKSNSRMAIDDIYHWGGNYADLFVYDIYPYLTFDYRYGEMGRIRRPRVSQLHYTMAQMRNMTTAYGKKMGFWVGTYNPNWFVRFHGEERKNQWWSEREISYTAIAGGCDYLISPSFYQGDNQPVDSAHWESYGRGMRVIQKEGAGILAAPKVKASACFLFPRTQHILLQQEYYNVGVAYELFLRAFGEMDIIHEEQITDETLSGYRALVMCDVELLPRKVAEHIARFVERGGVVIADCLPQTDETLKPMRLLSDVFGVDEASTDRIKREGQWVPFVRLPQKMSFPAADGVEASEAVFDHLAGRGPCGGEFDFKVTSPRTIEVAGGAPAVIDMLSGVPALTSKTTGAGRAYLLGFCVQDTYFQAWKEYDENTRSQLAALVGELFSDAGVVSHVHSSNPDVEAGLRAGPGTAYLFVINHETHLSPTVITLSGLGFTPGRITDVESGRNVPFTSSPKGAKLAFDAPFASTHLLKVTL